MLAALVWGMRRSLPRSRRTWFHMAVAGLLINGIPGVTMTVAQTRVSTSFTAVVAALVPLAVVVGTVTVFRDQRPTRAVTLGVIVGLLGILIFLGVWLTAPPGQWVAVALLLAAVASLGVGWPYFGHFLTRTGDEPMAIIAGQLAITGAVLLPIAVVDHVMGTQSPSEVPWQAIAGVLGLGLLTGSIGNVLSFLLTRSAGPAMTGMVSYAAPVVAVAIGVLFLGEILAWHQIVGAIVILIAIAIAQGVIRLFPRGARRLLKKPHAGSISAETDSLAR